MPSLPHELILALFRNHSETAADLLIGLNAQVPEYDEIRTDSSDLSELTPTEYRADLVLFLLKGSRKTLGIVVEVQLRRDEKKRYSWPVYVANLRARHRCPVCLLVITRENSVARWARRSIDLGPGTRCQPWVLGPSNMPAITELEQAEANVELAFLSAIEHARDPNITLFTQIYSAAIDAGERNLDEERYELYLDLLTHYLEEGAPRAFRVIMNSPAFEYKSNFARRNFDRGKRAGREEGRIQERVELVLKIMTFRFGTLTKETQTRVRGARDALSDKFLKQMMRAETIEQVLGLLR